jgi:hypothetical protein
MKRGPEKGEALKVSLVNAREAWGAELPDWVERLAVEADRTSQNQAGREIGYSGSVVHSVLKRNYTGNMDKVEKAVRGRFMKAVVECPVLGEIGADVCLGHQKRAIGFSTASSHRVQLARACRGGCPHSQIGR